MYGKAEWKMEKLVSLLRVVGCMLFVAGIYFVLHPFAALFSFIPFLKAMLSSLFFIAALLLAAFYALGSASQGTYDVYHGGAAAPSASFAADGSGASPYLPPPASFADGFYQGAVLTTPLSAYTPAIVFGTG